MLKKVRDLVIYHHPRLYCAFPAVATLADGRVAVAFRRARDHRWLANHFIVAGHPDYDRVDHVDPRSQTALLVLDPETLDPVGEPVTLPIDPEAADQDASLLVLMDGRVLLAGFSWYPFAASYAGNLRGTGTHYVGSPEDTGCLFVFWGGHTRLANAKGEGWSSHRYLPPLPAGWEVVPGLRAEHGGAVRGRPVQLADGTVLLATYAVDRHTGKYASHLFASNDGAETWAYRATIARDQTKTIGYAEPALLKRPGGRLFALHRTFGAGDRLATACSADGGRTWAEPVLAEMQGHPHDALDLGDGRVLLVYGYRHQPYGIRARIWLPEQNRPEDADEIVLRDDGASRDLGYPWATRLPDGRVLIVYYMADAQGVRHIAGTLCRLDPA